MWLKSTPYCEPPSYKNSSAPTRLSSLYNIPTSFINQTILAAHSLINIAKHAKGTLSDYEKSKGASGTADASIYVFAEPFLHFVKFINPNAKIEITVDKIRYNLFEKWTTGTIVNCRRSENLFKKHVVSRLVLSMLIVKATVEDIARGIFGVTAGALAVLSLSLSERLNNWATWGLQANVVTGLPFFGIIMYNPSMLGLIDLEKV